MDKGFGITYRETNFGALPRPTSISEILEEGTRNFTPQQTIWKSLMHKEIVQVEKPWMNWVSKSMSLSITVPRKLVKTNRGASGTDYSFSFFISFPFSRNYFLLLPLQATQGQQEMCGESYALSALPPSSNS